MTTLEHVRFVNDEIAIQSMRESDFDAYSAYGEVIDNSIQAKATSVAIKLRTKKEKTGKQVFEHIEEIAFGDDGEGMPKDILHRCLQLGFSSRFNDRSGIGRFGVGMTLAAIHECRRVEVYSKPKGGDWLWTYMDLDEMTSTNANSRLTSIPEPIKKTIPAPYKDLVGSQSGTLVVWQKYDRQPDSADRMEKEMHIWIGRTFRKFIWRGLNIFINEKPVMAIDPLYVTTERTAFPKDPPAHEYKPMKVEWAVDKLDNFKNAPETSSITIRMSLIDQSFRREKGGGRGPEVTARCIDRNEGISILRNDREVFYGHIPYWPGAAFEDIDRWWGCEISFDAALDRAFTVKNIKRGAVPNRNLKDALNDKIRPVRKTAVEQVRRDWEQFAHEEREKKKTENGVALVTGHEDAEEVAAKTATDRSELDRDKDKKTESAKLVETLMHKETSEKKQAWAIRFSSQPFSIIDETWKGPHFIETHHLGGADVIAYNNSHPFIQELYSIVTRLEHAGEFSGEVKKLKSLIDLLLISYSKAESKFEPQSTMPVEQFLEDIQINWGQYLKSYLTTWKQEMLNKL